MNEHEKQDEEIAEAMRKGGKVAPEPPQPQPRPDQKPVTRIKAPPAMQEFAEKARAEGPKPSLRDRIACRIGTPNTP